VEVERMGGTLSGLSEGNGIGMRKVGVGVE